MDFLIDKESEGKTVLTFLRNTAGISGTMLRHLKYIPDGILVNGSHVTVRHVLLYGELLSIKSEDVAPSKSIVPSDIEVDIAYEDEDIVVPDKPPFMPTHPSHGHFDDTVANALCKRYENAGAPFVFRPINRLDRNTSGLVLIARNRMAAGKLSETMKRGEIRKEYVAVLDGVLPMPEGEIETYIKRAEKSIIVRCVCGENEGGDYALTRYKVIYSDGIHTVVRATPITGRTHQLRLHFAHLGAPIFGDDMYGNESEYIGRHALHAARLTFTHPSDEKKMILESPLPGDMRELIERLFSKKLEI